MTAALTRTPVALLVFNRPALTERVFAAVAQARPSQLLVVADGPRADHPDDERLVAETRRVIEQVSWPCEVLTSYAAENLGCRQRISSGLDWVFSQVDEAIILEDDCLPDPSFFAFCEDLLERYGEDERVQMVSGSSLLAGRQFTQDSYYFSRWYHIWGWATWARAWQGYDVDMRRWSELRDTRWLEERLPETEASVVRAMFDGAYDGTVNTWDFQWVLHGWLRDGVCAKPVVNLVSNIGYGEMASHERNADHPVANLPTTSIRFPLRHPNAVEVLGPADRAEFAYVHPQLRSGERHDTAISGDLVMGAAIGLHHEQVTPFLRSLRRTGYRGDVVLFVDRRLQRSLANDPVARGVTLLRARQWLPFKLGLLQRPRLMRWLWKPLRSVLWTALELVQRLPVRHGMQLRLQIPLAMALYTPMETRFLRYRRYLRSDPHSRVLLTDVRDVLFQSDPFASLPAEGLGVSIEADSYTVATEPHNAAWIARAYGSGMLQRIGHNRVSCVGVTCGDAAAIASYLNQFAEELLALSPEAAGIGGADTAIHNVLVWTERLGVVHRLEPLASAVATLNAIPSEEVCLSDAGRVLNRDGSKPSVLHQYDRIPAIRDGLLRMLAS